MTRVIPVAQLRQAHSVPRRNGVLKSLNNRNPWPITSNLFACDSKQERQSRQETQQRAYTVQVVPLLKHRSRYRTGILYMSGQESLVNRQHPKESPRPICKQKKRPGEECRFIRDVPGPRPQQKTNERQGSLHGKSPSVRQLPLGKQGSIVKSKAGRLLGKVDIERRSGKDTRHEQGDTSRNQEFIS